MDDETREGFAASSRTFVEWVGRVTCVFCVAFVFVFAAAFAWKAWDAISRENEPVFTIAPDSARGRRQ